MTKNKKLMWEENEYAFEQACQEIQENELIEYQREISGELEALEEEEENK